MEGRRPEENRFLVNGVDYVGSNPAGQLAGPYGVSLELLGVDAVRELNVVQHTYGAEYGKVAGGQVNIVTSSGTNQLHGDAFEYLRNSVLDAARWEDNAFGGGLRPPFKSNQSWRSRRECGEGGAHPSNTECLQARRSGVAGDGVPDGHPPRQAVPKVLFHFARTARRSNG